MKDYAMKDYIEATRIIRDEMEYDYDRGEWKPFEREFRDRAFNALKAFVAATARGNRCKRILDSRPYNVNDWGILRRLWYYPDTGEVQYCCGQEWNSEMAILRDAFDWKKGR